MHGLHWQLNPFPQFYIGKWTVGLHLSTSRMVLLLHHLLFLDPPCVLQMPSFGRRAKAHLANTPTERLSLRQPLVLLRYTMNGFLASNSNGFIASNSNGFPRHLQHSCTGAAASFLQVAAIAAFSAGSSLRSSVCMNSAVVR